MSCDAIKEFAASLVAIFNLFYLTVYVVTSAVQTLVTSSFYL